MTFENIKVAVVGARSLKQGTGPWFAKHCHDLGAQVVAVMGRRQETACQARDDLKSRFGIEVVAYDNIDKMLQEHAIDLLVIATPPQSHRSYLWKALEYEVATMVEKPFVWDVERDNAHDAEELIEAFAEKKVNLMLNTQWLESLPIFESIYPECELNELKDFKIAMSPASTGSEMLVDALPHAWNMLVSLAGEGELSELVFDSQEEECLIMRGVYEGHNVATTFIFTFKTVLEQPRPFAYSINGCTVERVLDLKNYKMSFKANNELFPLEDPMVLRIRKMLTLLEEKAYNDPPRQHVLETKLLEKTIEASQQ